MVTVGGSPELPKFLIPMTSSRNSIRCAGRAFVNKSPTLISRSTFAWMARDDSVGQRRDRYALVLAQVLDTGGRALVYGEESHGGARTEEDNIALEAPRLAQQ